MYFLVKDYTAPIIYMGYKNTLQSNRIFLKSKAKALRTFHCHQWLYLPDF